MFSPESNIKAAARHLLAGGLVAMPTETVYGLGADALNEEAVSKIYSTKGRPKNHPLIVHVYKDADLDFWAKKIPDHARKLIDAFWPGPLTLVFKKTDIVPDFITGGQDTVAIRSPNHPVAQALLKEFATLKTNSGIVAPSANIFGHVSPTKNEHVLSEFPNQKDIFFLEGDSSEIGIESTILDLSREDIGPVLLRPGHISKKDIQKIIGIYPKDKDEYAPVVSGSLKSHYAPKVPIYAEDKLNDQSFLKEIRDKKIAFLQYSNQKKSDLKESKLNIITMPSDAKKYASIIYDVLRNIELQNYDLIIIEKLPQDIDWDGVRDRLSRALAAY
ncbi:L-threonylcarbamoyladenylate synthase [Taylorella asinigenitalis]|uniref:L-threonylcarbamoyladenylate synthase n=1 Tax=Taylorella asinigenitalis TaxID=84590 RepID=UPI00048C6DAA|nr:L-threonylcarbamoyladenylate synthase [Taylorella asinigenitalis]